MISESGEDSITEEDIKDLDDICDECKKKRWECVPKPYINRI